jgi:hypothetical protein
MPRGDPRPLFDTSDLRVVVGATLPLEQPADAQQVRVAFSTLVGRARKELNVP